jgi:hypothetical protein
VSLRERKILGGGMVGRHAGESTAKAAEVAHDSCTGVPPARK